MHDLAGDVAVDPPLDGGPGHFKPGGDLADRSPVVDDEADDLESVARGKCCVGM